MITGDRTQNDCAVIALALVTNLPYRRIEGWIYQEKDDEMELPAIEYYYGCPPDKSWEVVGNIFEGLTNE